MAATLSPAKQRYQAVFGLALTELFVLLLFLVVFLWVATSARKDLPADVEKAYLQNQIEDLEKREKSLQAEVSALKKKLVERDAQLANLWQLYKGQKITIQPGSPEWEKWLETWKKDVAKGLESGGRGHSNCLTKGAVGLITASDDGLEFSATWTDAQRDIVGSVPALLRISQSGKVLIRDFEVMSEPILAWADSQTPKCRFDVLFRDSTTQKRTYVEALRAVDRVFYKSLVP